MKIRNGFVSNSSSSSFLIIGREINDDQYYQLCKFNEYGELALYEGDDSGYVVGLPAYKYLEKNKLKDAELEATKDLEELLPDKYKHLASKKLELIWDSCYE